MGCPAEVEIGDNLVFSVITHTPATGAITDADGVPAYRIYEDETDPPILTGNMAKLDDDDTTGFYTESIAATSGNGFENGKNYNIYITAAVGGVTGGVSYAFKAYDERKSNLQKWLGTAAATPTVAGVPEVDLTHMEGVTQSVTDLKDFADAGYDPGTNKVQGVVLVDTTTTNTDMRGTDSALLAANVNVSAGIVEANVKEVSDDSTAANNLELDYDGTGYTKSNSTIGTTTANTDMRGTDNALLAANINVSAGIVESNLQQIGGIAQSATDLKDFADAGYDPSTNKVQGVVLVDTTTTNTDMRGTDSAATASALATAQTDLDTITGADGTTLATTQGNYAPAKAGDLMGLANDAITSAKYDESTAYPLKSDDSGSTQVARTGADSDTLETISDEIAAQNDLSAAQVNAEVVDVMSTDTQTLPGQGAPTVTPTIEEAIMYLYKQFRNKETQTATQHKLFADNGTTVDQLSTVSDDGTTFTKGEVGTGA
jgi:hypothetical protein